MEIPTWTFQGLLDKKPPNNTEATLAIFKGSFDIYTVKAGKLHGNEEKNGILFK